ncbi:MAG: penicillin-binding protein 2 [Anaerolineae bacterium]|nr:penicillin-binding protein 2 [Anaerolineae bacterium]
MAEPHQTPYTTPSAQGKWEERWALLKRSPRVILLGLLVAGILGLLTLRVWQFQVVEGAYYRAQAVQQSTRLITVAAPRGIIYDANGVPLVRNVPSFNVLLIPAYLPDEREAAEDVLIRLAWLLDMPYATSGARPASGKVELGLREMVEQVGFTSYRPLVVKRGVDRETAFLVAQQSLLLPGVSIEVESVRHYPYGPLVSQIVGYLLPVPGGRDEYYRALGYDPATDRLGMAGIEATYEEALRGRKGRQIVEEDVMGRTIRVVADLASPRPGQNVYLTLDLELQRFVEEALRRGMERAKNSPRGVAIVMNPRTGEILAMVSLPTYDNNLFTPGVSPLELARELERMYADPHRPLLNHAISDQLPPGSVFKLVVAAAALQEGVLTPYTHLSCPGTIVVPNKYFPNDPGRAQEFHCWKRTGHGTLDVVGGIAHSCDVFFYKTGGGFEEIRFKGLGVNRIAQYARVFGLGEPTGVELPAEATGTVPTADWKRLTFGESWATGDTYNFSIGQGFLTVTPLQMLNAVNAIANGGTLYRPRIVHHVTDAEGNVVQPFEPQVIRTLPISAEHLALVREGMHGAVEYGTSYRTKIPGIYVAGKTGTAQFCDDIMCGTPGKYDQPEHAWFVAYAMPEGAEEPEVSVLVFLYNGGEGSTMAVPVAHEILKYYFGITETEEPARGGDEAAP